MFKEGMEKMSNQGSLETRNNRDSGSENAYEEKTTISLGFASSRCEGKSTERTDETERVTQSECSGSTTKSK